MEHDVIATGERILLRKLRVTDAGEINLKIDSCPKVCEYVGGTKSFEETLAGVKRIVGSYGDPVTGIFAAVCIAQGDIIGWGILKPFPLDQTQYEIGYGVVAASWGQNYATEIGGILLNYGFNVLGLKRLVAAVNPRNLASKRVIHKLGFIYRKKIDWPDQGKVNLYALEQWQYGAQAGQASVG